MTIAPLMRERELLCFAFVEQTLVARIHFFSPSPLSFFIPRSGIILRERCSFSFFFFLYDLDSVFNFPRKGRAANRNTPLLASVVFIPHGCGRPETIYQSVSLFRAAHSNMLSSLFKSVARVQLRIGNVVS